MTTTQQPAEYDPRIDGARSYETALRAPRFAAVAAETCPPLTDRERMLVGLSAQEAWKRAAAINAEMREVSV